MSLFDSDIQRGFVQHRRSFSKGSGDGQGAPRVNQILEGEIAINLATRKIYTKRVNYNTYYQGTKYTIGASNAAATILNAAKVTSVVGTNKPQIIDSDAAGFRIRINGLRSIFKDSDNKTVSFQVTNNASTPQKVTVTIKMDNSITNASTFRTALANALRNRVSSVDSDALTQSVSFYNSGNYTTSFVPDTNFKTFVDFSVEKILGIKVDKDLLFSGTPNTKTLIDVDEAFTTDTRTRGTGVYLKHDKSSLYLIKYSGLLPTAGRIIGQREQDTTAPNEVVELNNIPVPDTQFPKPTNPGQFLVRNNSGLESSMYWFDDRVPSSIIARLDSEEKITSNPNRPNTAGSIYKRFGPSNQWGEWRLFNSSSVAHGTTLNMNDSTGAPHAFDVAKKFTIKKADGTEAFSMWGLSKK